MRRAASLFAWSALLCVLVCAGVAVAQDEGGGTDSERANATEPPAGAAGEQPDDQTSKPEARRHGGKFEPSMTGRTMRQHSRRIELLQNAVRKELSLSRDKQEIVDELFRDYLSAITQGPGRRGSALSPEQRARWNKLREEANEARKAGDLAALDEVREQMRGSMSDWQSGQAMSPEQFVGRVEEELNKSQAKKFRKLVQRYRVGNYAKRPAAALRRIRQASLRRAEVRLSKEQRRAVIGIIREAQEKLDRIDDDDDAANLVVDDARAAVVKLLSPRQREKFAAALEAVEIEDGVRRLAKEDRGRDRTPDPSEAGDDAAADEDSAAPEEPKSGSDGGGG